VLFLAVQQQLPPEGGERGASGSGVYRFELLSSGWEGESQSLSVSVSSSERTIKWKKTETMGSAELKHLVVFLEQCVLGDGSRVCALGWSANGRLL